MNPKEDLEAEITLAVLARQLLENPGWSELARPWLNDSLKVYDDGLKSSEFVHDHEGYLNARASYMAHRSFIEFIERTIENGDRARVELKQLDDNGL